MFWTKSAGEPLWSAHRGQGKMQSWSFPPAVETHRGRVSMSGDETIPKGPYNWIYLRALAIKDMFLWRLRPGQLGEILFFAWFSITRHPVILSDNDWDVESPPQQSIEVPLLFSGGDWIPWVCYIMVVQFDISHLHGTFEKGRQLQHFFGVVKSLLLCTSVVL